MDVGSTCEGPIEWTPFVRDDATAPDARLGLLARAFRAMPGDARLASAYGALLMNQLAFEQAIEPLTAAVGAAPAAAAPRTRLASCLVRLRNFEDALEALAFDGGEAPTSVRAEAAYVRGAALAGLGDIGAAETALQAALDIEPNHSPAFRRLSTMLADSGRNGELILLCDGLATRGVRHARLLSVRARTLAGCGRLPEAAAMLDMGRVQTAWIDPPRGFATLEAFNAALVHELSDHPYGVRRDDDDVYAGGRVHHLLHGRRPELIVALAEIIRDRMQAYVAELPPGGDPWTAARPARARLDCWGVVQRRDDRVGWHIHPHAWLSAVYYVAAPADASEVGDGLGCIEFGPPPEAATPLAGLVRIRRIAPTPGLLVLAPSHFHHRTIATGSDTLRVSVAFDLARASSEALSADNGSPAL